MARRVTTKEVLIQAREVAISMPPKGAVSASERHLRLTFESFTRSGRARGNNPKYVNLFERSYSQFRDWSLSNGFGLDAELELLGKHKVRGTKLVRRRVPADEHDQPAWYRVVEIVMVTAEEHDEFPEARWVTDYESARWVKHDNLVRRNGTVTLTAYGKKRFNKRRTPLLLEMDGETKSAAAWAKDERARVSDKVIKSRKESGWSDTDAISLPRGQKPSALSPTVVNESA